MLSRRQFLGAVGAGVAGTALAAQEPKRSAHKKMAIVTTEWRYHSHAWHMGERFLVGYPMGGKWHKPPLDVVSVYVDQTPANDLSKKRAKEFGFPLYPKIAEALRCGVAPPGGSRRRFAARKIPGTLANFPHRICVYYYYHGDRSSEARTQPQELTNGQTGLLSRL